MGAVTENPLVGLRADFPVLEREINGHSLVYLDNAATSQKPRQVIQALWTTTSRPTPTSIAACTRWPRRPPSLRAGSGQGGVRGLGGADEIVFTRNTTEALNLVAYTWAVDNVREGDEIVISTMEHHSNIVPWQWVAETAGAVLKYAEVDEDGKLDAGRSEAVLVTARTKLVSMMHVSNVLGTINPIGEIVGSRPPTGALTAGGRRPGGAPLPVDVGVADCDFFAVLVHKMLGPTGVGVLRGRRAMLNGDATLPRRRRDDRDRRAAALDLERAPLEVRGRHPEPIADAIALGAAVDYLTGLGMDRVRAHEIELTAYALEKLGPGGRSHDLRPEGHGRAAASSRSRWRMHPHDSARVVDYEAAWRSAGQHCCQVLAQSIGVPATARASFYVYNTPEEVDVLVARRRGCSCHVHHGGLLHRRSMICTKR